MSVVVDASVAIAAVTDDGRVGDWARTVFREHNATPHLMPVEAANMLRRLVRTKALSAEAGAVAHREIVSSPMTYHPYEPFAGRAWHLRENITSYDAWYVAMAEALKVPLATLDLRLARASGPECEFLTPP